MSIFTREVTAALTLGTTLRNLPVIKSFHTDDLVIDGGDVRVWVSRLTIEDGMDTDNAITIERLIDGVWQDFRI